MTIETETSSPTAPSTLIPTLPGAYYTSPEVFAREQELIFGRQWVYVGRADQLTRRGDFLRTEIAGQSVIIVRDRRGELQGYLNVCRHRGSRLCLEPEGNVGNAIRCPYHSWTYKLDDGSLITTPNWKAMTSVDKQAYGLSAIGVEEWNGLVWANLTGDTYGSLTDQINYQLSYRLAGDLERFERYRMADLVVGGSITYECDANWKIIFENFQECYHCGTIHPELVEQIPAFVAFDTLGDGYATDGFPFADDREAFSHSGKRALPRLPHLRDSDDQRYFGMVLRPNAFLSLVPDHVIVHHFEPIAPDHTRVTCDWLFTPEVVASDHYDTADSIKLFDLVNQQDLQASAWCQPNMSSPLYADGGVLVPTESEIIGNWFYPWYRSVMGIPAPTAS